MQRCLQSPWHLPSEWLLAKYHCAYLTKPAMSHGRASASSLDDSAHCWHIALLANSDYHDEPLPGVEDDSRALEACDFFRSAPPYRRWDNLTLEETRQQLHEWSQAWQDDQYVMFFFLGHGAYSGILPGQADTLHADCRWLVGRSYQPEGLCAGSEEDQLCCFLCLLPAGCTGPLASATGF